MIAAGGEAVKRLADANRATVSWSDAIGDEDSSRPPDRHNLDIDLASLIYTSGSTGEPKGIMLTHRNMLAAATSITAYLENREDDVILDALPLSFDYGLYQVIMAFRMGATVVLERSFAYPAQVLDDLVHERVTGFPGVPTMFATLAGMKDIEAYDFSSVRYVTNTAAAIAPQHIDFIRRTFSRARFYSMYGLTECKRVSYLPPEDLDRKPDSVGVAIPNTELWVVDERGERVGPGVVGELVVRGATVMKGYWNKPEATAERLRPGPLPGEAGALHRRPLPAGRGRLSLFRRPDGPGDQEPGREGGAARGGSGALEHSRHLGSRRRRDSGYNSRPGHQGVRRPPGRGASVPRRRSVSNARRGSNRTWCRRRSRSSPDCPGRRQ